MRQADFVNGLRDTRKCRDRQDLKLEIDKDSESQTVVRIPETSANIQSWIHISKLISEWAWQNCSIVRLCSTVGTSNDAKCQ